MSTEGPAVAPWGFSALVGLALGLCYLLTFPGTIAPQISDGRSMYLVTQSLVDRRDVAIQVRDPWKEVRIAPGWRPLPLPAGPCPTEPAVVGVGERAGGPYYSKYGLGQSLAAAPLYLAGTLAARAAPQTVRAEVAAFVTSAFAPLVTALTGALLCALALRLGWSRRVALALALLYGLATPAWPYTATFFSEPTIGLCLLGALAAVLWPSGPPSIAAVAVTGAWLAAATLVRPDSALYAPVFGAYVLYRSPRVYWRRLLLALGVPLAVALALIAWYNAARFGSPLTSGYGIVGDYHDLHPPRGLHALWDGVYGLLLSPGKGLFLYAPILLLLPWSLGRFAVLRPGGTPLVLAVCAVAVAAHANTLIVWLGGWAWGPRFLIPIMPVALLPIGALLEEGGATIGALAWGLGALGLLIQLPAVAVDKGIYIAHLRDTAYVDARHHTCIWHAEDLYKWHPQYSPLIGQWQVLFDAQTYKPDAPQDTTAEAIGERGRLVPEPHTWWRLLDEQGVPRPLLAVPLLTLALLAGLALLLAVRAAGPPAPHTRRQDEGSRASRMRVIVR